MVAGATSSRRQTVSPTITAAAQKLHKPPERFAMTALRTGFVLAMMIRSNGGQIVSDDDKKCRLDSPEELIISYACGATPKNCAKLFTGKN